MNRSDKRRLVLIGFFSVLNSMLSVAGIASILPFIGLISQPELLDSNRYIVLFSQITGMESYSSVILALGGISLLLLVVGNLVSLTDTFLMELFGHWKDLELSERLLKNYLLTDVLEFEKKKSSERAKEILSDVDRVILDTLFSMFSLVTGCLMSFCIFGLLFWVDMTATLVVTGMLIGIYLFIHNFTSTRLDGLGKEYARLQADLYGNVLDALKLQKEIKLTGISSFFLGRFTASSRKLIRNRLKHTLIDVMPDTLLEVATYGIILLVAIYFAAFADSDATPITLVGMYAFAAYRLIPAVADIFNSIEGIIFGSAILEDFIRYFDEKEEPAESRELPVVRESIALSRVFFRFTADGAFHLDDVSLVFPVGKMTCIKGRTGCGKSTILNLVAGLYHPSDGHVAVDGVPFDAYHSAKWKSWIGLVPPAVNLIQSSLYENIALGIDPGEIDRDRVHAVSELVDINTHIRELKHGYDSIYGEAGLSFSNGQIQKLGLARALYRNPAVLLLDESTNAFDLTTESLILSRLKKIKGLTIIFVSHRPSVMEHADKVIDLENLLRS